MNSDANSALRSEQKNSSQPEPQTESKPLRAIDKLSRNMKDDSPIVITSSPKGFAFGFVGARVPTDDDE
jgi:hypothetical protein